MLSWMPFEICRNFCHIDVSYFLNHSVRHKNTTATLNEIVQCDEMICLIWIGLAFNLGFRYINSSICTFQMNEYTKRKQMIIEWKPTPRNANPFELTSIKRKNTTNEAILMCFIVLYNSCGKLNMPKHRMHSNRIPLSIPCAKSVCQLSNEFQFNSNDAFCSHTGPWMSNGASTTNEALCTAFMNIFMHAYAVSSSNFILVAVFSSLLICSIHLKYYMKLGRYCWFAVCSS